MGFGVPYFTTFFLKGALMTEKVNTFFSLVTSNSPGSGGLGVTLADRCQAV